jgi:hypothetical protein
MRWSVLIVLAPLVLLIVWAAMFDLRRRRRGTHVDSHEADAAIRGAKGKGTGWL